MFAGRFCGGCGGGGGVGGGVGCAGVPGGDEGLVGGNEGVGEDLAGEVYHVVGYGNISKSRHCSIESQGRPPKAGLSHKPGSTESAAVYMRFHASTKTEA